jgi:hypothetical protein
MALAIVKHLEGKPESNPEVFSEKFHHLFFYILPIWYEVGAGGLKHVSGLMAESAGGDVSRTKERTLDFPLHELFLDDPRTQGKGRGNEGILAVDFLKQSLLSNGQIFESFTIKK